MNTHNNKWMIALVVILAGAAGVEGAMLYRAHQEQAYNTWGAPWQVARRDPFAGFARMQQRMDRWLSQNPFASYSVNRVAVPNLDVKDSGRNYTITANLPGMDKSDINVSLKGQELDVSGSRNGSHRTGWFGHHGNASSYSSFQSSVDLPGPVDSSGMEASYKHGVLKITVPKEGQGNGARRIPVQ